MKYPIKSFGPTYTITNPFAIGWILIFMGLIPIIVGITIQLNTWAFLSGSVSTTGTVIQCKLETTSVQGTSTNNFPVVSFQTQSGQHIIFTSSESDNNCWEGDTRTVRYRPDDPQNARLDSNSNAWVTLIVIGSLLVLWGLFSFLRGAVRKVKESKTS